MEPILTCARVCEDCRGLRAWILWLVEEDRERKREEAAMAAGCCAMAMASFSLAASVVNARPLDSSNCQVGREFIILSRHSTGCHERVRALELRLQDWSQDWYVECSLVWQCRLEDWIYVEFLWKLEKVRMRFWTMSFRVVLEFVLIFFVLDPATMVKHVL
jgi:hypothetical protein